MTLLNITEYVLKRWVKTRGNHCALILVDDIGCHRQVSYEELYRDVCCLLSGLHSLGLAPGAVICIQADDVYDLLVLFLAAIAAGMVPVPLLVSLSENEIDYILQHANAQLFFSLTNKNPVCKPQTRCRIVQQGDYLTLKNQPFVAMQVSTQAKDPAFIFYTSGSSGPPKGVIHAQHAILGRIASLENWLVLTSDDIVMQTDNLCWTYSMFTGFLDPLSVGATALVITPSNRAALAEDNISGEKWLGILDYYHVTVMISTPNIYNLIVTNPQMPRFTNQYLRQAGSAGAMLADDIQQLWIKYFRFPIFIALGMSEISTFISDGPAVAFRKNTVGKIQPGRKVRILPIDGGFEAVPPRVFGMLAIHRDELGLMRGYVGDIPGNRDRYRGDWFLTQDIVSQDEEGYIQYNGRADLIIKVDGGFRVSPIEIERELKSCPAVVDAACGAIFDPEKASNQLVAYLVTAKVNQQVANAIHQFLVKRLSDYKVPRYLYFVDSLPLTNRGKVIRKDLGALVPRKKYEV